MDVFIPEVWGDRINDFFKSSTKLANFFTDRSSELYGGGDVLHTPNTTEMSATEKANATAVTLASPTETKVDLTVDQHFEVSFMIEDRNAAQVKQSYSLQETYAKNAAYSLAKKLDTAIATLFSGISTSVGASSTNLADSEIRAAISTLEANGVPNIYGGDVAFIMHPNTFWRQVQGSDKFSLAINTNNANNPTNEPTYKIYGIPVIVSNFLTSVSGSRQNLLAHKDAFHWATARLPVMTYGKGMIGQHNIRVQSSYIPDYLGTLTTADIVYGVVENRDGAAVLLKSHATGV